MAAMTFGKGAALVFAVMAAGAMPAAAAAKGVQAFLDSRILASEYNGALADYLLAEGGSKLAPEDRDQALAQLASALKDKIELTGRDLVSPAAEAMESDAEESEAVESGAESSAKSSVAEWNEWIAQVLALLRIGRESEAAFFFKFGLENAPAPAIKARCLECLADAAPAEGYELLTARLEDRGAPIFPFALSLAGRLAADERFDSAARDSLVEILLKNAADSEYAGNSEVVRAAILGLDASRDMRAIEMLAAFKGGETRDKGARRAALRSLLLTFDDRSVVDVLKNMVAPRFFGGPDADERFFAGMLLLEAGEEAGYAWAENTLASKKGLLARWKSSGPDRRAEILAALLKTGGAPAAAVLRKAFSEYTENEPLKREVAIALVETDGTEWMPSVRATLDNPQWDFASVRAAAALARHGDYSGLGALQRFAKQKPPDFNEERDSAALQRLRIQTAETLAALNLAQCLPVLQQLLGDGDASVRRAAASALAEITEPAVLDSLEKAFALAYDSAALEIQARLLRAAGRFAGCPQTAKIIEAAGSSDYASVRFMALCMAEARE